MSSSRTADSAYPWNDEIWTVLTRQQSRRTHAWLFSGPRGVGKTDLAIRYARHLCLQAGDETGSAWFEAGTHPDMHVLAAEARIGDEGFIDSYARRYIDSGGKRSKPSLQISVQQVRALTQALTTKPHGGFRKIALILVAEDMNINAANALLKLLEEPTDDTVFICTSNNVDQLPATIRSRCAPVACRLPPRQEALDWLEQRTKNKTQAQTALDIAGGAPLVALEIIESDGLVTIQRWKEGLNELISGGSTAVEVGALWKTLGVEYTLEFTQRWLIDLIRYRMTADPKRLFNPDAGRELERISGRIQVRRIFALLDRIAVWRREADGPLDDNLLLEDVAAQIQLVLTPGAGHGG